MDTQRLPAATQTDIPVRNVFAEGELEGRVLGKFCLPPPLGGRPEAIYSLDVVISVGDYLFKQVTSPDEPSRRRIGFGADENDMPRKPYAKL